MPASPAASIFDLFEAVRASPGYVFGTFFVPEDFLNERVPEGFDARHATDWLATAGNEYISLTVDCDEEADYETTPNLVLELLDRVREHPDWVFGTIFVIADFPGGKVPEDFSARHAIDCLAEAGNEYIELTVGCGEDD